MISYHELVKAGVHFGHPTARWCPKMNHFIWGHKNGIHLIDVSKTAQQLEKASKFLHDLAAEGKVILWVGTKKVAQAAAKHAAETTSQPYVTHRWVGGTLTNFSQVRKSITKYLHYKDVLSKSTQVNYTKKELSKMQKTVDKLEKNIGGMLNLTWPIGALVVADVRKEQAAVREAGFMNVPVIALVDTDSDPSVVAYPIPANDDSAKSIAIIFEYLSQSVAKGKEIAQQKATAKAEQKELAAQEEDKQGKERPVRTAKPVRQFEKKSAVKTAAPQKPKTKKEESEPASETKEA